MNYPYFKVSASEETKEIFNNFLQPKQIFFFWFKGKYVSCYGFKFTSVS